MNNEQLKINNYQLPEGYKQTEGGVIPEDWEETNLADIVEVIDGDRGTSYPSDGDFSPGGYCLFLSARNVTKDGFRFSECFFITEAKDRLLRKGKLSRKDVVLTTRGTVGNFAFFDNSVPDEAIRINSGMVLLRNKREDLNHRFLYIILRSYLIQNQIERTVFGSAQPQLTVKGISEFRIPLPPIKEQRSLAQVLSDVDALIAALDKLIAKKRNLKTATMQQLLTGKKRLPGFGEGQGYKESAIGLIPKDWDVSAVGDICDFIVPGRNKPKIFKGNIPWITTPDLEDGRSVYRSKLGLFVSRNEAKSVGSKIVPSGAVIISCVGELGIVAFVETEIVINQQLHAFIPSPIIDSIFLLNALQAQQNFMLSIATQTAVPYLNKDNCNSIPIPLPSCLEQRAIATVLSDMDAEIAALESRLAKTQSIKQGMMQELLTGRTRLV